MKQFYLEIVTPTGRVFEGEAQRLTVPTVEGPVCIMAGHIDYFAKLDKGSARLVAEGNERTAYCSGGVMSVSDGRVTVSAMEFEWK